MMVIENPKEINQDLVENRVRLQSRQIEQVFDINGLPAQVVGGSVQADKQLFSISSTISERWRKIQGQSQKLLGDIKKSLKVQSVKLKRSSDGHLQLQIIRPVDPPVPLQDLLGLSPDLEPASAVLGLDEVGRLVTHDFHDDSAPNMLIIGGNNSGKTALIRTIITSLAQQNKQSRVQMIYISPKEKRREKRQETAALVEPLNLLPHMVTDITHRFNEIIDTLLFIQRELVYRQEQKFAWPRIILFIDSAAAVLSRGGQDISQAVHQIAERGPEVGIHLVLATDQTGSEILSPHLVANLQTKIVGHFNDSTAADLVLGQDADQATNLLGAGDFLLMIRERTLRFQAGFIDNYDLHAVLKSLLAVKPVLLADTFPQRINLPQSPQKQDSPKDREFVFIDELVGAA